MHIGHSTGGGTEEFDEEIEIAGDGFRSRSIEKTVDFFLEELFPEPEVVALARFALSFLDDEGNGVFCDETNSYGDSQALDSQFDEGVTPLKFIFNSDPLVALRCPNSIQLFYILLNA